MVWKEVHNSETDIRNDSFFGFCPKVNKQATVTVYSVGSRYCKTDLQKTYRQSGFRCSLRDEGKGMEECCCLDIKECPLVPDKYL